MSFSSQSKTPPPPIRTPWSSIICESYRPYEKYWSHSQSRRKKIAKANSNSSISKYFYWKRWQSTNLLYKGYVLFVQFFPLNSWTLLELKVCSLPIYKTVAETNGLKSGTPRLSIEFQTTAIRLTCHDSLLTLVSNITSKCWANVSKKDLLYLRGPTIVLIILKQLRSWMLWSAGTRSVKESNVCQREFRICMIWGLSNGLEMPIACTQLFLMVDFDRLIAAFGLMVGLDRNAIRANWPPVISMQLRWIYAVHPLIFITNIKLFHDGNIS